MGPGRNGVFSRLGNGSRGRLCGAADARHTALAPAELLTLNPDATQLQSFWDNQTGGSSNKQKPNRPATCNWSMPRGFVRRGWTLLACPAAVGRDGHGADIGDKLARSLRSV